MAGFLPDEGENWIATQILTGNDFEMGLFTNSSPGETITEATITEPTGTGYARIALTGASCTVTGDTGAWVQKTFTAGAGGWTGSIKGYFICKTTAPKRIVAIEVDASLGTGVTMLENDTYKVTPSIRFA